MLKKTIAALVVLAVLVVVAVGLFIWRRPMTAFAWTNRRALANAGFAKLNVPTPVGPQTLFAAGSGPAIVFLHGAGDNAGTWSKVAPALAKGHRVLVLDMPGHGESAPTSGPLDMATILKGTEAVIDREACAAPAQGCTAAPVTIVGNSLGAWIAMLYAHNQPDRVARLVLVNGGALIGNRPDLTLMPASRAEAAKLFDNLMDSGSPKVPGFVLDDIVRESQRGPIKRMADAVGTMPQFLLEGRLHEVTVPVDLLWGESDRVFSLDYARRMEADLPAVRLTTVPRCGHVPQQECPVSFSRTLQTVLEEQPPSPKSPSPTPSSAPVTATSAAK